MVHLGQRWVIWLHPSATLIMHSNSIFRRVAHAATIASFSFLSLACAAGQSPEANWPPVAKKWFDRAQHSYHTGDMVDAEHSIDNALSSLPHEAQVKQLAAQIAMTSLEFERALQLLSGQKSTEAAGLRGRCHWYLGNLDQAAVELELVASDPEVKDGWAKNTLLLARSGRGRKPFEISGGLLAAVEMPKAGNSSMFVPLEVNGEPALAMVATDRVETVIDGREPGWVSLRFGGVLEVSDVPVVAQDLAGLSKEIGVPIKILLGVHFLRRTRATVDVLGQQFVVRSYEPPPPPAATTLSPMYYRGGALVVGGAFGEELDAPTAALLVNTSMLFPLALDEAGWRKAGQDPNTFMSVPGQTQFKHGMVPLLRLGAFEIAQIPGVLGAPVSAIEKEVGMDLDGVAGSGLFSTFRLTFADQGRTLWLEDLPPDILDARQRAVAGVRAGEPQESAAPALPALPQSPHTAPEGTTGDPGSPKP